LPRPFAGSQSADSRPDAVSSERLRVLRIVTRLNVGGPSLHVCLLTGRLDPDRFESRLAAGVPNPEEGNMLELRPDLAEEVGDRLIKVPGLGRDPRVGKDTRALYHLHGLIGEFRPHIVHTHMAKAGTLGRLAAAARRVPLILHTFHGTVFQGHFHPVVGRAIARWERIVGAITHRVLAVSPSVATDLRGRGIGRDRVEVIPLGLDLEPFLRVSAIAGPPPRVATLVARLAPVKDVPLFLQAVELVRTGIPDLEVRIVGDGPLRERLARSAPPWVSFLGNRGDLPEILETTGAVALTSHSEGSPVALIEALAAGRPVVSTPVGGAVDILRERPGALLSKDRSPSAIADALHRALTDPAISSGAEETREEVANEFGVTRLVRDISSLYEEMWRHVHEVAS
jgi:glycosyltransferase involved in cell wall biosynthesis